MDGALDFLILTIWNYSLGIVIKQKSLKPFAIITTLISIVPIAWGALDCYQNTKAEKCVWAKSFMALSLRFAITFTHTILFLVCYFRGKV